MNNGVNPLAVAPDGTLYAGGYFSTAGGISANRVAKWNGMSWSALDNGLNSTAYALAVAPDGTLYAGGRFTNAGGVSANYIAEWRQAQMIVSSMYGQANPAVGTHMYDDGAAVTCYVADSPVTIGTTQYVCTGWAGSGSVPASGTTTNTGEFTITADSTITWDWSTNYYLNLTTGGEGGGTLDVASGWFFAGSNITITATPSQTNFFVQWGGDTAGATINELQITFALGGPKNITATFLKYRVPAFSTWALIACGLGLAAFMWLKFRRLAESA